MSGIRVNITSSIVDRLAVLCRNKNQKKCEMYLKLAFLLCGWLLLLTFCAEDVLARTAESLKVKTDSGVLVGRHLTTHNGRPIRAFMGIPYAQPPVGVLRFKVDW